VYDKQAAERFLKAYLVGKGAVEIRYPDDWFMPSQEDAKEAREAASKALGWLENALPEILKEPQNS
jgi:HEPN domain-containing protein